MEDPPDSCHAESSAFLQANATENRRQKSRSRNKSQKTIPGIGLLRTFFGVKSVRSSLVDVAAPVTATAAIVGTEEAMSDGIAATTEIPAPTSVTPQSTYIHTNHATTSDGSDKGDGGSQTSNSQASSSSKQKQVRSPNWDKVPARQKRRKPSPNTIDRRLTRKYKSQPSSTEWYHKVATKNKLGSINENVFCSSDSEDQEAECESDEGGMFDEKDGASPSRMTLEQEQQQQDPNDPMCAGTNRPVFSPLQNAKRNLLNALNRTKGDSSTPAFQKALQELIEHYDPSTFNTRQKSKPGKRRWKSRSERLREQSFEGIGISAGKPSFPGCIGRNDDGDPLYKLGTMSFDMFTPTQLVVSVQGTFCLIDVVDGKDPDAVEHIPNNLLADVRYGSSPVRTYNLVTPFTIEPWTQEFGVNSPNKGIREDQARIRGIMTTYGFILPYPTQSHRFSVWFTGGSIEMVEEKDDGNNAKNEKWFQIFDHHQTSSISGTSDRKSRPKRTVTESGKLLAAKLLMGASTNDKLDEEGRLSYTLTRPMSSHIDLIYLDEKLQVLRGSSGTVYVHVRIPGRQAVEPSSLKSNEMLPQDLLDQDSYLLSEIGVTPSITNNASMDQEEPNSEYTNAGIFL